MSKKNKNNKIVEEQNLQSYTVTTYGTERKQHDFFKEACNKFLTESSENILSLIKKENI